MAARESQAENSKSANHQNQKTSEQQDMQKSCARVSRMLPLTEPILQDAGQALPGTVKSDIVLSPKERNQPAVNDETEPGNSRTVNENKQRNPGNMPINRLCKRRSAFGHSSSLLRVTVMTFARAKTTRFA
jgi:hypothetical protein